MKRKTQWIAIALLTGAAGLTSAAWADSCERLGFDNGRWDGQGRVISESRMITTSRPGWVVKEEALRTPGRSGFVVVEPTRSDPVLLRETTPVVSRQEIVLEPVGEKTGMPMRHVIIRERLAPVAEGPLHTGPATIREHRYIKRTVHYKKACPEFKSKTTRVFRRTGDSLEAVGERTKYTVKRTAKRTGNFLSDVAHRTGDTLKHVGQRIIGEPEPVAERTYIVEPIYDRDNDMLLDNSWYDLNNPYR